MTDDLAFGDVQFSQPELGRRPDRDPRYAVVAVGRPDERELPIFVALETLRAIENHVAHDTSIELGGVLVGSQHLDDSGRPFVVIGEALEAQHYEATKGSFKFTLDTWQDLLQRVADYPPPLRIVGWYHSHPGWGVFLSEMDLFICQGFFNNPLDVALVVDPCQDRRGWFHWQDLTSVPRKQQNVGFYLFDSRYRQPALQQAADLLNAAEQTMIPTSFGSSSRQSVGRALATPPAPTSGSLPAPIFISSPEQAWWPFGLMAMVGLQTLLIGMLGWAVLKPTEPDRSVAEATYEKVLLSLIGTMDPDAPAALTQQRLQTLLDRQREVQDLTTTQRQLLLAADASHQQLEELGKQLEAREAALRQALALNRDLTARVQTLEAGQANMGLGAETRQASAGSTVANESWWSHGVVSSLVGILGLTVGGLAGGWWIARRHAQLQADLED